MNREEIEKLIEETARKERSKRKGVSVQKVRSILNVVFSETFLLTTAIEQL